MLGAMANKTYPRRPANFLLGMEQGRSCEAEFLREVWAASDNPEDSYSIRSRGPDPKKDRINSPQIVPKSRKTAQKDGFRDKRSLSQESETRGQTGRFQVLTGQFSADLLRRPIPARRRGRLHMRHRLHRARSIRRHPQFVLPAPAGQHVDQRDRAFPAASLRSRHHRLPRRGAHRCRPHCGRRPNRHPRVLHHKRMHGPIEWIGIRRGGREPKLLRQGRQGNERGRQREGPKGNHKASCSRFYTRAAQCANHPGPTHR